MGQRRYMKWVGHQLCRGEYSLQYRCGAKAANDLAAFINSRPVSCMPLTVDRYRRTVASCAVAGVDLADWLARQGLALDWPRFTKAVMPRLRTKPAAANVGCGRAAMSSRGGFARASGLAGNRQRARMSRIKLILLAGLRGCNAPTGLVDPSDQHDLGVIACTGADVRPTISDLHAGLYHRRQFGRVWLHDNG
jgi:hypothetical protein